MKTIHLKARLRSDVIFSERSATTGGHEALDYIPGAAILGLCASRLYSAFGADAFTVFHSGQVRFGNGYPLDGENNPTIPTPLSWHIEKGKSAADNGRLLTDNICNMIFMTDEMDEKWRRNNIQPKQVREGYFSMNASCVKPLSSYRLKTAIERTAGGRPKGKQLFGYESLNKGTAYYFSIECDDAVGQDVLDKIINILIEKPLRIGKSRTAEYGAVKFTQLQDIPINNSPVPNGRNLIVYCLSDVALRDSATATPTLTPKAVHFHRDSFEFAPKQSFIRSRSYSPFNGTWRTHDLERHVICKGSIISFTAPREMTQSELLELQNTLSCGVGMYRQDGLGKVLINPAFLSGWAFVPVNANQPVVEINTVAPQTSTANTELIAWLDENTKYEGLEKKAGDQVEAWLIQIMAGVKKLKTKAPGKSQWGQLRTIALQAENKKQFEDLLLTGDKALCTTGVTSKKWAEKFYYEPSGRKISFMDFIKNIVLTAGNELTDPLFYTRQLLYRLGSRMPHAMNQEGL